MSGAPAERREGGILIPPEGFGLVFMGGGAKGAYQLGVWQALRELDIPIHTVTGASIGSINGALLAQGEFDRAVETWHSIRMDQIVQAEGLSEASDNLLDLKNLTVIAREIVTRGGLDTGPLREMLGGIISEEKIRASGINYGLTTFSKNEVSTTEIFLDEIPEGQLLDYVMASACFPIFRSVQIGEQSFIDGGIGDNMPVNMLIKRGLHHIITVDIGGVGVVRPVKPSDATIIPIKHSMPLGALFDLSHETLSYNQNLGYMDTMRVFGRYMGESYFFTAAQYRRLNSRFSRRTLRGLEEAARLYGLRQDRLYSADEFLSALMAAFEEHQPRFELKLTSPAFVSILRELKAGNGLTGTMDGPMRLHAAMESIASNQGIPSRSLLTDMETESLGAQAMLTLVRLGPLPPEN